MMRVRDWTVDYGDGRGPNTARIPHAWRQELEVAHEGPAVYRTVLEVPVEGGWLLFNAVSYAATVRVDGVEIGHHTGLWDAFSVSLVDFASKSVNLEVSVLKNGGPTYPVASVASGFIPYVFNTFGGIYGDVELRPGATDPLSQLPPAPPPRVSIEGSKLMLDSHPFYMRGVLHWGWYPDLGHPNPDEATILAEIARIKAQGFNTVKFCLWVPSHRHLELLDQAGMVAWLELPAWNIAAENDAHRRVASELEAIVRQYRRHPNIIVWTVGCEMGAGVSAEFRSRMTALVRSLTGCPMVKDDSGGAEMFGGDPREFGSFYDFHPYCDLPFFPTTLASLMPGPRRRQPTLLGEFNDFDSHRDLARLLEDHPFWASALPEFNDLGVRWQHDLPAVLRDSRFAHEPRASKHEALLKASQSKGQFIRTQISDAVRAEADVSGYVVAGLRDTPISSSGFFDDWDQPRFSAAQTLAWNGPDALFLIPSRKPIWLDGGNRPGYMDSINLWTGPCLWRIGIHSESGMHAGGLWRLTDSKGIVAEGAIEPQSVGALSPTEVGQLFANLDRAGTYILHAEFGHLQREWTLHAVDSKPTDGLLVASKGNLALCHNTLGIRLRALDELNWSELREAGLPTVIVLSDESTVSKPFWRECVFEYHDASLWERLRLRNSWEKLLPISGDRFIDTAALSELCGVQPEPLMVRIDTRTYEEHPCLMRIAPGVFATTLRPFGGLGSQPPNLVSNPAGAQVLRDLFRSK